MRCLSVLIRQASMASGDTTASSHRLLFHTGKQLDRKVYSSSTTPLTLLCVVRKQLLVNFVSLTRCAMLRDSTQTLHSENTGETRTNVQKPNPRPLSHMPHGQDGHKWGPGSGWAQLHPAFSTASVKSCILAMPFASFPYSVIQVPVPFLLSLYVLFYLVCKFTK